jgi:hypothetical protein
LGFSPSPAKAKGPSVAIKTIEETFHSVGFIYSPSSEVNVIPEDNSEEELQGFMIREGNYQQHHVVASTPSIDSGYRPQPQAPRQSNNQNRVQGKTLFDPIPMTYAELLPILLEKNLVQVRAPPRVPAKLPWWYKVDRFCVFHQGAPGHSIEDCWALKYEVQRLTRTNVICFKDQDPNLQVAKP